MNDLADQPLPQSWAIAQLADVSEINPGLDKSEIDDELEVSFVPMPAVEAESGRMDLSVTRKFGEVKKGYTAFSEGDVLFAKITPCMENGKMAVVPALKNGIGFGSTEFHVLRPKTGISDLYLYYFVSTQPFRRNAEHNMTGAVGQRRVPMQYLAQHEIPVPPESEQRRIVAKIEELFSELDKGVESLTAAREQLNTYRQSVLKHAFDGKATSSWRERKGGAEWTSITVGEASEKVVDCLHSTPRFAALGKYCVDSTWMEDNKLLLDQARYVDEATYSERIRRLKPERGDVILVREGSKKIGTALAVNFDDDFCLGQRMMMFRLRSEVLPQYFVYYIQSDNFKKQYKPLIGGSASPHLNISDIKRMRLPLCSFEEQREIVRFIESQASVLDAFAATIGNEIEKSQALRQSILKRAFSGKLVAQDPTDEPVPELLERIRAEREESGSTKRRNNKNGKKEAA